MIAYLAPGRSAATNGDPVEAAASKGWSPTAIITALQSTFPKLTLVAEVKNPEAFSKALDAIVVALNKELKAQAMEKALEERKEDTAKGGGANRGGGRFGGGGGDRTKTRRPLQQTPAPRFEMTPTAGKAKVYSLTTPSGSPLHLGPASFRPTIHLDGDFVVFALTPDSARTALTAVRRKDWKPSDSLAKVCENAPDNMVVLAVSDVSETLPSVLASLPGTLQTMINTSVALAKSPGTTSPSEGQTSQPGSGGPGVAMEGRSRSSGPGGRGPSGPGGRGPGGPASGVSGSMPGPGALPGGGIGNTPSNSNAPGSSGESAIVFNIDAEKLPKPGDLKAHLFPSTLTISVSDQDIRIVSRGAFPDFSSLVRLAPIAGLMPAARSILDPSKVAGAGQTAGAAAQPASPGAPGASRPGGGQPQSSSRPGLPGLGRGPGRQTPPHE
jgi:hypothetical protein